MRSELEKRSLSTRFLLGDISVLVYLALVKFLIHFFVNLRGGYGIFRDEFYYLACADHLAFGYVDHPPLSILLLGMQRFLLGDSLLAIRFLPAVAGGLVVFLTGLIVREIGGGRFAQMLGAVSALVAAGSLGVQNLYSMNAFDHLIWTLAFYVLVRVVKTNDPRLWLWLGVILGLGLQNKISVLFLGFGLVVVLLFTHHRRHFTSVYFWFGGLIGVLIFLPYIIWQVVNGWPTLEFISNAQQYKITHLTPWEFFLVQVRDLNPLLFAVWIAGLLYLLLAKSVSEYRLFGLMYIVIFAAFALQRAKPYYLFAIYPILFAAGAIFWGSLFAKPILGWLKAVTITILIISGALLAPFAMPILPAETYVKYAEALGQQPRSEERTTLGKLPQHFADMHGWENWAVVMSRIYRALNEEDRKEVVINANNYGEAAALDYYRGKRYARGRYDIPKVICGHNSYWHWGTQGATGEVVIVVGGRREDYVEMFETVELIDLIICEYCMPYENNLPVYVCRGIKRPLEEVWPELKLYI